MTQYYTFRIISSALCKCIGNTNYAKQIHLTYYNVLLFKFKTKHLIYVQTLLNFALTKFF